MTASSLAERLAWFRKGVEDGHDFMIVATDTWDYEDYPVYTSAAELQKTVAKYDGPEMQWVMEVFNLKLSEDRVGLSGFVRDDRGIVQSTASAVLGDLGAVLTQMSAGMDKR